MVKSKKEQKEKRFERWLVNLAAYIKGQQGTQFDLVSVGRRLGDHLIVRFHFKSGLCEIHVLKKNKGGVLYLLAENKAAAEEMHGALSGLHKLVSRFANAKRKFMHRLGKMAEQLWLRYDTDRQKFPQQAYEALCSFTQSTVGMTGLEALFRQREHESEVEDLQPQHKTRSQKRYWLRFGAYGAIDGQFYSFSYDASRDTFTLLEAKKSEEDDDESISDWVEAGVETGIELGADAIDSTVNSRVSSEPSVSELEAGDCGGFDLPDCGGFDVPDCSCDCSL